MVDLLCANGRGQGVLQWNSGCWTPVVSGVNSSKSEVKHEALSHTKSPTV